MKGTRPLDNDEIRRVSTCFTGTFATRNRGLFMLGVSTDGRISELLINSARHTQKRFYGSRAERTHRDAFIAKVFRPAIV